MAEKQHNHKCAQKDARLYSLYQNIKRSMEEAIIKICTFKKWI